MPLRRALGPHVLLLQGPMGLFFTRLAAFLRSQRLRVSKVNFNPGDDLFYRGRDDVHRYRGRLDDWPAYLEELVRTERISAIFVFGDCRPYHRAAKRVADRLGVGFFVFEEGYVRPDYITLESGGVNGHSNLAVAAEFKAAQPDDTGEELVVEHRHAERMLSAVAYYTARALFGRWLYPHYIHHKRMPPRREAWCWAKAFALKPVHRVLDTIHTRSLGRRHGKPYYFVPLQVYNDAQVTHHSPYESVAAFIEEVVASFAQHAPADTRLVFKHHPMDRGHVSYGRLIRRLGREFGIRERLIYIHEGHLPSLLRKARGTVVINSTVGFSSLFHGTPVKVLGRAIYKADRLTASAPLDEFWRKPGKVDRSLFKLFRDFLISETQLRGAFFGTCPFRKGRGAARLELVAGRSAERLSQSNVAPTMEWGGEARKTG